MRLVRINGRAGVVIMEPLHRLLFGQGRDLGLPVALLAELDTTSNGSATRPGDGDGVSLCRTASTGWCPAPGTLGGLIVGLATFRGDRSTLTMNHQRLRPRKGTFMQHWLARSLIATVMALMVLSVGGPAVAQDDSKFDSLTSQQHVYDDTDSSLSAEERTDLRRRIDDLRGQTDADVVVYVRDLQASPKETLRQVEALQQAWVSESGAGQDTAVAILINRNPDDDTDARAGIYVGSTFNNGNVPRGEQENIVADALIPPLRDGDVHVSLVAGLDRLGTSIINGPPRDAFQEWATDAADSWAPWTVLTLTLVGFLGAGLLFRRRATTHVPMPEPTTTRPGSLPPALAGALTAGGPQASAIPSVILDLATRDALAIEQEKSPGKFSKGTVQIRLLDRSKIRDDIDAAVWEQLAERADGSLVTSNNLKKVAQDTKPVRKALHERMDERGWRADHAPRNRTLLVLIGILAGLILAFSIVVASVGGAPSMLVGILPVGVLMVTALIFALVYSGLSSAGLAAAAPWKGYRKALKQAAKDESIHLDLDTCLPDLIAVNLGAAMKKRLDRVTESGDQLLAFSVHDHTTVMPWGAFAGVFASSSGSAGASGASGAGAGGGGGAAGST